MRRRTQVGLASVGLTLLWAAGLYALFVGGNVGQHPSVPMTLALSGAVCAVLSGVLLTLACFPGLGEYLRAVAQMAAVGASLEAVAVVWSGLPMNDRTPDLLNELEFSNFLLLPSMVALLASSVLYFASNATIEGKSRKFENSSSFNRSGVRSFIGSPLHTTATASRLAPTAAIWATARRYSPRPGKHASVSSTPLSTAQTAPLNASVIGTLGCCPTLLTKSCVNSGAAQSSLCSSAGSQTICRRCIRRWAIIPRR